MDQAHDFLRNLALVLGVAAATTILFQRLHQPVVFGYLLAGMIVGPHIPIPLVADVVTIQTLSELGVILLMFSLGLEFSLRKIIRFGPTAALIALVETSFMIWLGYSIGRLFGWTITESLYAGAIIAISSTTIIVKAFAERGVRGKFTDIVFGVLIVEDLIAILLLAILTAVSTGTGISAASFSVTAGRLVAFLVGLIVVGLLIVPRLTRAVVRLNRPETTLVASMGICFSYALLALTFGYSVVLGAFIAGSLVAESGEEKLIAELVHPVRDMFVAIFFVAVGMLIDPTLVARHWRAVLVLTLAVVVGKTVAVALGTFLTGQGMRTSIKSGMSLAQIGEFSFIIAGLGLSTRATREFLYPVALAVSALTTLLTPWLIRGSDTVARYVDRKLPKPLQTFVALYGSWVEQLRAAPLEKTDRSRTFRLVRLLVVDAVLLAAIVIGASLAMETAAAFLASRTGTPTGARLIVVLVAALLALPFSVGIIRTARFLGLALAQRALPAVERGKVDLALAPRRALVVTLQLGIVLLIGVPLIAITQPFVSSFQGAAILVVVLGFLGVTFWRSTTNLQGHARAGAQAIVEALAHQTRGKNAEIDPRALARVKQVLPGLGDAVPVRLDPASPAVGKTLAELDLRGLAGASVLVIIRGEERLLIPTGKEVLRVEDVLALVGTHEAVDAAKELLLPSPEQKGPATV